MERQMGLGYKEVVNKSSQGERGVNYRAVVIFTGIAGESRSCKRGQQAAALGGVLDDIGNLEMTRVSWSGQKSIFQVRLFTPPQEN